jgi:PTS system fructose-specific IIC component
MSFTELLQESLIEIDLKGTDKYQVIEELLDLMVAYGVLSNKKQALKDSIDRENYLSTGLENGLAVPHAKTRATEKLVLAMGISSNGIEFDSLDGKPAHYIFLLLSPVNTSGPHIKVLSEITKSFRNEHIFEKLSEANSAKDYVEIIRSL